MIQHFSTDDAKKALRSIGHAMRPGAVALIQMPNARGLRNTYHRIGNRRPREFDVRYWTLEDLAREFDRFVGATTIEVDNSLDSVFSRRTLT